MGGGRFHKYTFFLKGRFSLACCVDKRSKSDAEDLCQRYIISDCSKRTKFRKNGLLCQEFYNCLSCTINTFIYGVYWCPYSIPLLGFILALYLLFHKYVHVFHFSDCCSSVKVHFYLINRDCSLCGSYRAVSGHQLLSFI